MSAERDGQLGDNVSWERYVCQLGEMRDKLCQLGEMSHVRWER